ncbi:MAG TPA: fructosamine kinase family protein [Pirellulaceae bacterium]|nr:fructosamine kinase family protein [Pirellulaceae bacterium]HMO92297.1 fructosamine kinase family protein [Pirellulaceae bacterium]HMP71014.1 fructosamine kinase family protein [Pirellulaceae bacterium]
MTHGHRQVLQMAVDQVSANARLIVGISRLGGGCISEVYRLRLIDGTELVAKLNSADHFDNFSVEACGLELLRAANVIRVPQVIANHIILEGQAILLMEYIQPGRQHPKFQSEFGTQLAYLHQAEAQSQFGLQVDNFIGDTEQINTPSKSWVDFFRDKRLGFQLRLASRNNLLSVSMLNLADRLLNRLDDLLHEPAQASLIHGDLWSGNYFSDLRGAPVIIDPAVYFADREAEFGMIELFGGLGEDFFNAYNEVWPLPPGYQERFLIYKLYHLLNHLNLFGSGYLEQCVSLIKQFA